MTPQDPLRREPYAGWDPDPLRPAETDLSRIRWQTEPELSESERHWAIRMGLTIGIILGFFLGACVVFIALTLALA